MGPGAFIVGLKALFKYYYKYDLVLQKFEAWAFI